MNLRPLEKIPADVELNKPWFVNSPIGMNTLNQLLPKMSEKAFGMVKYTNHSLRATAASRLFEKNVPEKIIGERTGHRSLSGLRSYECTSTLQDQAACNAVSSMDASFSVIKSTSCQEVSVS